MLRYESDEWGVAGKDEGDRGQHGIFRAPESFVALTAFLGHICKLSNMLRQSGRGCKVPFPQKPQEQDEGLLVSLGFLRSLAWRQGDG